MPPYFDKKRRHASKWIIPLLTEEISRHIYPGFVLTQHNTACYVGVVRNEYIGTHPQKTFYLEDLKKWYELDICLSMGILALRTPMFIKIW